MKRFDKRYVYCSFVGDLFGSFLVLIAFLGEFISEYESLIAGIKAIFPIFAMPITIEQNTSGKIIMFSALM